jgi:hypothetical protein
MMLEKDSSIFCPSFMVQNGFVFQFGKSLREVVRQTSSVANIHRKPNENNLQTQFTSFEHGFFLSFYSRLTTKSPRRVKYWKTQLLMKKKINFESV